MRTTSFPDASVQAPRVGRIQAMRNSDATGATSRRAVPDCSKSDFQDRSSPESGSPSERAGGSDPALRRRRRARVALELAGACGLSAACLSAALLDWPQHLAAWLQAVLP